MTVPGWASHDLLITGPNAGGTVFKVDVWSLPEGRRLRTIDFEKKTWWEPAPQRIVAETLDVGSDWSKGSATLRSWALPDGEPVELGRVDRTTLRGKIQTLFGPNGDTWLHQRSGNLYARPLPIGSGPDRLLTRLSEEMGGGRRRIWPHLQRLALADGSVATHIWTLRSDGVQQERIIPKLEAAPRALMPDASGHWLVHQVREDRLLHLWNTESWSSARPLHLRRNTSWFAAGPPDLHPTGDWIAAATGNISNLTLWPLTRPFPAIVDGYSTTFRPLAFSPDGRWLATGWAWDGILRLWPLPGSGTREVRTLALPEETWINNLAFGPQGRFVVAVADSDWTYVVPLDGSPPVRLDSRAEGSWGWQPAVSPLGRFVAMADWYGQQASKRLRVWNLETNERRVFELPEGSPTATSYERGICCLVFADERTLYTSGDGGIRRWNLESGSHKLVLGVRSGELTGMSVASDRRTALVTTQKLGDATLLRTDARLVDLATGETRSLPGLEEAGYATLDHTGTIAMAADDDGVLRVGLLSGGQPHLLFGHEGSLKGMHAFSPDGRWLATTGEDNTLRLWPMPDLSKPPLHTLPRDELIAKLKSLTNFRAVRDPEAPDGWKIELDRFPGWKEIPTW